MNCGCSLINTIFCWYSLERKNLNLWTFQFIIYSLNWGSIISFEYDHLGYFIELEIILIITIYIKLFWRNRNSLISQWMKSINVHGLIKQFQFLREYSYDHCNLPEGIDSFFYTLFTEIMKYLLCNPSSLNFVYKVHSWM